MPEALKCSQPLTCFEGFVITLLVSEKINMPIYEYKCDSCGYEFEKLQKISDPAITDCPECSRQTVRKLISAAGFRLKGGGWYETDFKTGNKRNVVESGAKTTSAKDDKSTSTAKKPKSSDKTQKAK